MMMPRRSRNVILGEGLEDQRRSWRRGSTGEDYLAAKHPETSRASFEHVHRRTAQGASTPQFTLGVTVGEECGLDPADHDPRGRVARSARLRRRLRVATSGATPRVRQRWAAGRVARSPPCWSSALLTGSVGTEGRDDRSASYAQVRRPSRSSKPSAAGGVERAPLSEGVAALAPRAELPPAAPSSRRGPRQDRHLLHACLQPGLDEPRRTSPGSRCTQVTRRRSAATPRSRRTWNETARSSPTTSCRWASRPRASRHDRATRRTRREVDQLPPARACGDTLEAARR